MANVALLATAQAGDESALRAHLTAGANVAFADREGNTGLIWGANGGHQGVVRALLEGGAGEEAVLNAKDHTGMTALMASAMGGHEGVVGVLLEAGARVDLVNKDHYTAAMLADKKAVKDMLKLAVGDA
jgi:ankyrin repeat protein